MLRTSRLNPVVIPLIALVAALTLVYHTVEAQVKPFKVKGAGNAPEGLSVVGKVLPYTMSGTATQLGKYSGFGIAQVIGSDSTPTDEDAIFTGSFTGGYVFMAANGDQLVCEHPGTFGVYLDGQGRFFAVFDAIFSPKVLTINNNTYASTARFANVSGSFRMIAITGSFDIGAEATTAFDLEWEGAGSFSFPKK